jgi:hypothetical protein
MFRKFASIAHPDKYGYAYDSEQYKGGELSPRFRQFETYGDRNIQHSGDWAITLDFAIDYLNSLTVAMLDDEELCDAMSYPLNHRPSTEDLKFSASLKYNEVKDSGWNKTRYFSVAKRKVTRDQEKSHDDRYTELKPWHNGTPEAIFAMVVHEYSTGLERWQYAQTVREWAEANLKNGFMEMPAVFLKWFNQDYELARQFRSAFTACRSLSEAHRLRDEGRRQIESYKGDIERKRAAEARDTAALEVVAEAEVEQVA